ncbi:MAG TPA: hypothetical protein VFR03_11610 [Thermoanaerobaculia bacterium]|nr:hypothetical protein [Thermoanaerobaculia bacterium]
MKRMPKKLTLSRETLGTMDESRLPAVAGGFSTTVCTNTWCSACCTTVCTDC